jgi:hypothetical protein
MYDYNLLVNKPWQHQDHTVEMRHLARDYYAIAVTWDEEELIDALDRMVT